MKISRLSQSLDGGDFIVLMHGGKAQAGVHAPTVDVGPYRLRTGRGHSPSLCLSALSAHGDNRAASCADRFADHISSDFTRRVTGIAPSTVAHRFFRFGIPAASSRAFPSTGPAQPASLPSQTRREIFAGSIFNCGAGSRRFFWLALLAHGNLLTCSIPHPEINTVFTVALGLVQQLSCIRKVYHADFRSSRVLPLSRIGSEV